MKKLQIICSCIIMSVVIGCENKKMDSDLYQSNSYLKDVDHRKYYSSEVIPAAYQNFYGKWRLEGIVGGFAGQGGPADFTTSK